MSKKILYEWEKNLEKSQNETSQTQRVSDGLGIVLKKNSLKDISNWQSNFGPKVIDRDEKGYAKKVEFSIYLDNKNIEIYLVGDFNNWNDDIWNLEKYKLKIDKEGFGKIIIENIKHKDKYKFLVVEDLELKYFADSAGVYFDDKGNSVFWDFDCPDSYKQKYDFINNFNRSTKIMQTDLPGLISHFKSKKDGNYGRDIKQKDYFKFITESGVIEEIKNLGFNTIQFLPFAQSIDGDNWKLRYLVPFQYGIQKNWGNPDEFSRMIDEFHKNGIAIIGDFVIGHIPHKDFQIFGEDSSKNGLHIWKKKSGDFTYLKEETSWGTMRPDFDNQYIREFFISSCIHFLKAYKIDGFRIDNVDGIIRYGDNGEGDERDNGRNFLRDLNKQIYSYNRFALIHFEAHYFYGDNAKMLVIPISENQRALGATAYNESRLTHYFHKDYMLKTAKEVSIWKFKYLIDEKVWGQSNSTVADFHNHDAAAGLMSMRCTGSYAFDSMTFNDKKNTYHAREKIKVMEAIISLLQEGRTLDLLQTHLLQLGTFEHDSSIHWDLKNNNESKEVLDFKVRINNLMDDDAFWPINIDSRQFLNLDEENKIIIFEKKGSKNNFIILINISDNESFNYKIPVKTKNNFELVFEKNNLNMGEIFQNNPSNNFELIDREIELKKVESYSVYVFREK